jgi:hypothetical protein
MHTSTHSVMTQKGGCNGTCNNPKTGRRLLRLRRTYASRNTRKVLLTRQNLLFRESRKGGFEMTELSTLKTALIYAEQDLGVLPLWGLNNDGSCTCNTASRLCNPGKHPIGLLAPAGHRSATTNLDRIADWFSKHPTANIGIELEKSGLVAVDIDYRTGGEESDYALTQAHGPWPDSWMHQTGNGWHQLFVRPVGNSIRPRKIAPGVDLMISGYVVSPPSIHSGGTQYVWDSDADPREGHPLAQVPDWLIDEINQCDEHSSSSRRIQKLAGEVRRMVEPSARLTNRILTDQTFADVWAKQNPSPKRTDLSDSGWCYTLALKLFWKHFSDQEVIDALDYYRAHIGAKYKPDNWFLRTCSNAKSNYLNALHGFIQSCAN